MKRRTILIIVCITAVIAVVAGAGIYYLMQDREEENEIESTDTENFAVFELPSADSLMVGMWIGLSLRYPSRNTRSGMLQEKQKPAN